MFKLLASRYVTRSDLGSTRSLTGTRTTSPPVIADRLASVWDKALAGDHSGGAQTAFAAG
ncbi:hypothetical protein AQJ23_00935 [Streptomyces antibioticus]|nr:hypothetical protein [Streptomyces antibioticus]KUN29381.1 hypothetical protein AQJ23_00935 [Streptomyces antibioticus]